MVLGLAGPTSSAARRPGAFCAPWMAGTLPEQSLRLLDDCFVWIGQRHNAAARRSAKD